jgi:hypothetical protein
MSYKLLNRVGGSTFVTMLMLCYWHAGALAQTGGCMSGSGSGSSVSSGSGTTASSTSSGSTVTAQQLSAASASLQQLLQSGQLNIAQQQRVTSMLRSLQNAQAGSTLSAAQVRQINAAMAVARNIAARQASGATTTSGGAASNSVQASSALRSSALASGAARSAVAGGQRSLFMTRPGMH